MVNVTIKLQAFRGVQIQEFTNKEQCTMFLTEES